MLALLFPPPVGTVVVTMENYGSMGAVTMGMAQGNKTTWGNHHAESVLF